MSEGSELLADHGKENPERPEGHTSYDRVLGNHMGRGETSGTRAGRARKEEKARQGIRTRG